MVNVWHLSTAPLRLSPQKNLAALVIFPRFSTQDMMLSLIEDRDLAQSIFGSFNRSFRNQYSLVDSVVTMYYNYPQDPFQAIGIKSLPGPPSLGTLEIKN